MGNRYNQHLNHQNLQFHRKNTFLPMLCSRPSIKDVSLPKWENRSASFSDDPLSPKISCMGQVKRNNKIIGFPTTHKLAITTKNNTNSVRYFKLKKFFSGKNLTAGTTNTIATSATTCRRRELIIKNGENTGPNCKLQVDDHNSNSVPINIVDLDPPLPVIKKVPKQGNNNKGGEADTLWKRRSAGSGVALKSLQLQQIQLNRHHLELATV